MTITEASPTTTTADAPTAPALDVRLLSGTIGAEIRGVDVRHLDADTVAAIRQVWVRAPGRVLPRPAPRPGRAPRLRPPASASPPRATRSSPASTDNPEVFEIDYTAAGELYATYGDVASYERGVAWHTDVTFVKRPPLGSILRAVVVPEPRRRHPVLRPDRGVRRPEPGAPGRSSRTLTAVHDGKRQFQGILDLRRRGHVGGRDVHRPRARRAPRRAHPPRDAARRSCSSTPASPRASRS